MKWWHFYGPELLFFMQCHVPAVRATFIACSFKRYPHLYSLAACGTSEYTDVCRLQIRFHTFAVRKQILMFFVSSTGTGFRQILPQCGHVRLFRFSLLRCQPQYHKAIPSNAGQTGTSQMTPSSVFIPRGFWLQEQLLRLVYCRFPESAGVQYFSKRASL